MTLKNKNICIWGYGATGRSAAQFAHEHSAFVTVMDQAPQPGCPWPFVQEDEGSRHRLLAASDLIIPSPGIDIRPYHAQYEHKWLPELDLFARYNAVCALARWQPGVAESGEGPKSELSPKSAARRSSEPCEERRRVIAITGSLGKTSVTSLLSDLLSKYGLTVKTGGNIGTSMLDLLSGGKPDYILLEVSSFQLEHTKLFAPDIAVITNIHENHLDRHGSMESYIRAKSQIFARQKRGQVTIAPPECAETMRPHIDTHVSLPFISRQEVDLDALPPITFRQNWHIIASVLDALDLPLTPLTSYARDLQVPSHRLELVPFRHGIFVYNDSKSTTPAATMAALVQLNHPNVILFLGGLSKGVDRTPLIAGLSRHVRHVYSFGTEATALHAACRMHGITSHAFATLDDAWRHCAAHITTGDCILFSPAGSSFDLFDNYQKRGKRFKQLVAQSR